MFKRPHIMGILNVTPDSFSDGGRFVSLDKAIEQALMMRAAGVDILDIGGESTRPGASDIDIQTEMDRVIPLIKALNDMWGADQTAPRLSIDTRKAEIAQAAIKAGAHIWNDVTALTYAPSSLKIASELNCQVVLMHAQGSPQTMQINPHYEDVVSEVKTYLANRIEAVLSSGVSSHNIIIDPGVGFGKRQEDNLQLLNRLDDFHELGYPILIGTSRKSFIGKIDHSEAYERLGGSIASALWAMSLGANILRVHDVAETVQAVKIWEAMGCDGDS